MRIVVVEDEKHLNRIISEAMEDEGYSVDSCFNGADALEYALSAKYDVMILDIMLPKLDGLELVRRLRRRGDTNRRRNGRRRCPPPPGPGPSAPPRRCDTGALPHGARQRGGQGGGT